MKVKLSKKGKVHIILDSKNEVEHMDTVAWGFAKYVEKEYHTDDDDSSKLAQALRNALVEHRA